MVAICLAAACSAKSETGGSGRAILGWQLLAADNPGLAVDVAGTVTGTTINATVPFGTAVTKLVATFTADNGAVVTVDMTAQVSGKTANDYSQPVDYLVTAVDGSQRTYVATVTVASSSAKAITTFAFLAADNPALSADVAAVLNGSSITATVPFGTNVTALIATFSSDSANVTVGGIPQVSGTTRNDFSQDVLYTVTAADGTTAMYPVHVTVAASGAKEITLFAFLAVDNSASGLLGNITASINGSAITATVPFGTDVGALVASFSTTGTAVVVGGTAQVSGVTANDFGSPVTYTITAGDGTTRSYTVTVVVAPSDAKEITQLQFLTTKNAGLSSNVTAMINGTAIAATVPFGTDRSALIATFVSTGTTVMVGTTLQVSGTTPNDFTAPVSYLVTAADGSMQTYTVTVTVASNPAKALTQYDLDTVNNPQLTQNVVGAINGTSVTLMVPSGTIVTGLVATFQSTGQSVKVGTVAQVSGVTANDFSSPVTVTVTAADGTSQDYTVTVMIAASAAADITAFKFKSTDNSNLTEDVVGVISGTDISLVVPFGAHRDKLIATFATTGASVAVGGVAQNSGTTMNDFTSAGGVAYVVTAADGSMQTYTVTVTNAPKASKTITVYSFLTVNNPGLTADVHATITGQAIAATVPSGTVVTALVATFTSTGTVDVGGVDQFSDQTANDFTMPVTYNITAADASTTTYTVTVSVGP